MADPELGASRAPGGPARVVQRGLAAALAVVGLLFVLHVPGLLRIALFRELRIGLALGLTFLSAPVTHRSPKDSLPLARLAPRGRRSARRRLRRGPLPRHRLPASPRSPRRSGCWAREVV